MGKILEFFKNVNPVCQAVLCHQRESADLRGKLASTAFPTFNHVKDLRHVRNPR